MAIFIKFQNESELLIIMLTSRRKLKELPGKKYSSHQEFIKLKPVSWLVHARDPFPSYCNYTHVCIQFLSSVFQRALRSCSYVLESLILTWKRYTILAQSRMKYIPFINSSLPRSGNTMDRENHHLVTMGILRNHVPSSFSAIFLQRSKPSGLLRYKEFSVVLQKEDRIRWKSSKNHLKQLTQFSFQTKTDVATSCRLAGWRTDLWDSQNPGYPNKTRHISGSRRSFT